MHVDRAACAWLIRRFVDPDAEFVFSRPRSRPRRRHAVRQCAAPRSGTTRASAHSKPRWHRSAWTVTRRLEEIGRIVHEADLADERYDAPAAAGLDVLIRGRLASP